MQYRLCRILGMAALVLIAEPRQSVAVPPADAQGTYLGVLFGPVAAALYDQLPQLPRQQGVIVTQVLPDSPAATADLHRHDILLTYDGNSVRDCEHFARLIRDDKPGRQVKLTYLRAGRAASAVVTLASGPALQLAGPAPANRESRAQNRAGAPASVNVSATALDNGQLKVTFEYYPEGSDRLREVTWQGNPADLDSAARALPERERQLARHALDRLRSLNASKAPAAGRPPS